MRNLRKLTAVVIAIALVLTSMTAAFAASTPVNGAKAETLKSLELYQGKDANDATVGLGDSLTVEQALVFLARLFGYDDEADALSDADVTAALEKFEDAGKLSTFAKKIVAYSAKEEILAGSLVAGKTYIGAQDVVPGFRFATFILRQMGYTVDVTSEAVDQLAEVKGVDAAAVTEAGDLTRDEAVGVMYAVLTGETKAGATVISNIVGTDAAKKEIAVKAGLIAAPTTLAVDSVTSTNLREVFVKFNTEADKDTANTVANYGSDKIEKAELQADKVTVKLTVKVANANQQEAIDLTIKNVKNVAGTAIEETKKSITLFDKEIPEILGYKFTGPTTIEVNFSEPLKTVPSTVLVDNGVYGTSPKIKSGNEYVVEVELGTAIPEGAHKLLIKGAKDFAGYAALDKELDVTYTKDSSIPAPKLEAASETEVTITFSKPVKFPTTNPVEFFYHSYSTYKPEHVTYDGTNDVVAGTFYDKVVLKFPDGKNPLPEGNVKVVVKAKVGSDSIVDKYGIVLPEDVVFTATIKVDYTAPTITKVEATAENKIEITYSENVVKTEAEKSSNYTFKKSDGTKITPAFTKLTYADNKVTIELTERLSGGAYTVEVANITDVSLNKNKLIVVAQPFTVTDKTAIDTVTEVLLADDGKTLYVTFPENMAVSGANSALEKANYLFGTTVSDAKTTDAAITVFGTPNKVKIVLDKGITTETKVFVKALADASGNVMSKIYIDTAITADAAPIVTAIKTVDLNKIELTVNKYLSGTDVNDFVVNGYAAAQASYVNSTDTTGATITVILNGNKKLSSTGDKAVVLDIVKQGSKSITGKAFTVANNVVAAANVTDGVAPTAKAVWVSATEIKVTFDEEMNAATFAGAGKNGFSVSGGTLTEAITKNVVDGKTVLTLTGKDFTVDTDVTYTPGNLADKAGNALATFTITDRKSVV